MLVFQLTEFLHLEVVNVLVGTMANWILFGMLWVQLYLYFIAFPKDKLFLKLLVLVQVSLETFQTVAVTHDIFRFFSIEFTNVLTADSIGTVWYSVPLITGLIASLSQGFYCYRVAYITKSKYPVILIIALIICQFGASVAVSLQTKQAAVFTSLLDTDISLITIGVWGGSGLICDIVIAVIMTYYLRIRDTGFKHTHNVIKRLIRLSIETGSITASLAAISLILVYLPHHLPYYQVAALLLAKTYSNSMVAALNSRVKVVSNCPETPCWNESVLLTGIEPWDHPTTDLAFRRAAGTETTRSVFTCLMTDNEP